MPAEIIITVLSPYFFIRPDDLLKLRLVDRQGLLDEDVLARFQGLANEPGVEVVPHQDENRLNPRISQDLSMVGDSLSRIEFPSGMGGGHPDDVGYHRQVRLRPRQGRQQDRPGIIPRPNYPHVLYENVQN